jgi:hypothetical protein
MTPSTIAAMCADYRASFHLDRGHDATDRAAGRRIEVPLLVVTGGDETQLADAETVWRSWATDLIVAQVAGGHFLPEEARRRSWPPSWMPSSAAGRMPSTDRARRERRNSGPAASDL